MQVRSPIPSRTHTHIHTPTPIHIPTPTHIPAPTPTPTPADASLGDHTHIDVFSCAYKLDDGQIQQLNCCSVLVRALVESPHGRRAP